MKTWAKRIDFLHTGGGRNQTPVVMNEFLDKAAENPFFLWVNFSDPHHPWERNTAGKAQDPAKIPLPAHRPDLPGIRDDLARYYDEIEGADDKLGMVLATLEKRGLAENTLVIFMGDNGHAFPHGKGSLYEKGLNVPCVARWPQRIKARSGRSFLPLLEGAANYKERKHIFAARLPHGNSNFNAQTKANTFDLSRCARSASHKLIWNYTPYQEYAPVDSARGAGWREMVAAHQAGTLPAAIDKAYFTRPRAIVELFDLAKDPGELSNVAGQPGYATVEEDLKIALQEKMVSDYDFLPPPFDEASPPAAAR